MSIQQDQHNKIENIPKEQHEKLLILKHQINQLIQENEKYQNFDMSKITDEQMLLRILIARQFDIKLAEQMWIKWIQWRIDYNIDQISIEEIESELISGKAFWHQYDRKGNPCCIVRIKYYISKQTNINQVTKFFSYLMEIGIKMSEKSGTQQMCVIWDKEGFSLKNFDINFINQIKQLVSMFQDNYAERLSNAFILHSNYLMESFYNIFKPFLADKVKQKIIFIKNLAELNQYFEPDCILKIHGGDSNFEYNYPRNTIADKLNMDYILPEGNQSEEDSQQSDYISIENNSTQFFNILDQTQANNKTSVNDLIYENKLTDFQKSMNNIEYYNSNNSVNGKCCTISNCQII